MCHFFNGHNLLRLAELAQDGESWGGGARWTAAAAQLKCMTIVKANYQGRQLPPQGKAVERGGITTDTGNWNNWNWVDAAATCMCMSACACVCSCDWDLVNSKLWWEVEYGLWILSYPLNIRTLHNQQLRQANSSFAIATVEKFLGKSKW